MAFVKLRSSPEPQKARVVYLVDHPVGRRSANRWDDVLLVQFLIAAIWDRPLLQGERFGTGRPPKVDAMCGPETIHAIEVFQKFYWPPTKTSVIDGRVEPLPPDRWSGPVHGLFYTILGLNSNFSLNFGSDRHAAICNEPNFPPELKPKLFFD